MTTGAGTVLVTDGEQRASLAVTRSLGRAGYRVIVIARGAKSLAGVSRFAAGRLAAPDPADDPGGFADVLADAVRRESAGVVLPVTEAALLAALPVPGRFAPAAVPFVDVDTFRAVCDKGNVLARAADLGIAVPASLRLATPADRGLAAACAEFPVVVKPERSVRPSEKGLVSLTVSHAESRDELERVLEKLPDEAFPLQIQQRIVGEGTGLFFLRWGDRIVARFAHRRIREKPPSGGVSVYSESVPIDEELAGRAVQLLETFGWRGVAMVEFKRRRSDGLPFLMEINGRFWGSLQLAVDSGVDFPRLLVEAATGRAPATPPHFRTGQRCRWWWGDVDQLATRIRRSAASLHLPPGTPGRLRALAEVILPGASPGRHEVLRLSDPRPGWYETRQWFRGL